MEFVRAPCLLSLRLRLRSICSLYSFPRSSPPSSSFLFFFFVSVLSPCLLRSRADVEKGRGGISSARVYLLFYLRSNAQGTRVWSILKRQFTLVYSTLRVEFDLAALRYNSSRGRGSLNLIAGSRAIGESDVRASMCFRLLTIKI